MITPERTCTVTSRPNAADTSFERLWLYTPGNSSVVGGVVGLVGVVGCSTVSSTLMLISPPPQPASEIAVATRLTLNKPDNFIVHSVKIDI